MLKQLHQAWRFQHRRTDFLISLSQASHAGCIIIGRRKRAKSNLSATRQREAAPKTGHHIRDTVLAEVERRIEEGALHSSKRRKVMTDSSAVPGGDYLPQRLSVAPMMDWTDVHYRQLARLITKHTYLYTEMVVDSTVIHTDNLDKILWFPPEQRPVVCQLGGSDPVKLAKAAAIVEQYGYDEINLNCGCPSDRVAGAGCFGAKLMLDPELVAQCCCAMRAVTSVPITVKCRIGVDSIDDYNSLCCFVRIVAEQGGIRHFVIHARKCILKGLSPAQNRSVPPLRRGWVYALKRDFPDLEFSLNGVIEDCHQAAAFNGHSHEGAQTHGVMIGRAAYHYPWHCLSDADKAVFGAPDNAAPSRRQVFEEYGNYADSVLGKWGVKSDGTKYPNIRTVIKPLLGMLHAEAGVKKFKQELDRILKDADKTPGMTASKVIQEALASVHPDILDAPPVVTAPPPLDFQDIPETPEGFAGFDSAARPVSSLNGALDSVLINGSSNLELEDRQESEPESRNGTESSGADAMEACASIFQNGTGHENGHCCEDASSQKIRNEVVELPNAEIVGIEDDCQNGGVDPKEAAVA